MKEYNPDQPTSFVTYLDANNLYGWAMNQYMPYGGFEWVNPDDFKLENVRQDSDTGHMLEVDLEYPESLHDLHNDYPFCPEQVFVEDEMLSNFSKNIAEKHNLKNSNYSKLISNFCKKEKYIIHE